MSAPRTGTRQEGFTLIETLIALVILSVALAGMIPVLIHSVRGNSFGEATTLAASWSQDKLEEFVQGPFDDVVDLATNGPYSDNPDGNTAFEREWRALDISGVGDVFAIEVCTALTLNFGQTCFPAGPATPSPTHHFLTVRANYEQ